MVKINWTQVKRAAQAVAALPEDNKPLNFYSFFTPQGEIVAADMYPPLHHPRAVDFFFFICLHNYGFWHGDEKGYAGPLIGMLNGKQRKGSDMLWRVSMRQFNKDPNWFLPERLAEVSHDEMRQQFFADDNGTIPFPDLDNRISGTQTYGRWFISQDISPSEIVSHANRYARTLHSFFGVMREVPGFNDDPIEKRQILLAMALHNRPEGILRVTDHEQWRPVVDYHLMRVCLRSGIVELDVEMIRANRERAWVDPITEEQIRHECFRALKVVQDLSGRSHALNDLAFWKARKSCPEMQDPDCDSCHFRGFCEKRTELFQPVLRTTHY